MKPLRVLDLFAGIGGFSLGLERCLVGNQKAFQTVAFCEIDPYAQKVLAKHWPGVPIYEDVRELTAERLASDGIGVDVITGGFPCQDLSVAGKQGGITAERSGLWGECARLLGELRPQFAVFENVTALLSGERGEWFKRVLWDISQVGFDAEWHCIPASQLGAHHHRDRVWIIAYPNEFRGRKAEKRITQCQGQAISRNDGEAEYVAQPSSGQQSGGIDGSKPEGSQAIAPQGAGCFGGKSGGNLLADTDSERGRGGHTQWEYAGHAGQPPLFAGYDPRGVEGWDAEPDVGRVANGVSRRVDRLRCLGNAVVPQIPELIGRAILEAERA